MIGKGLIVGLVLVGSLLVLSCGSGEDSVSVNNRPPAAPAIDGVAGGPLNNALNAPVPTTLHWTSYDPDGDPLVFNVYFGSYSHQDLIAEGVTEHSYLITTTTWSTYYYWKIEAIDPSGESATSSVWNFRTAEAPAE